MYTEKNNKLFNKYILNSHNENDINKISSICKALSTPLRIQMINLLQNKPLSLTQIAKHFDLPISTTAFNLQLLVDANILTMEYSPTKKGRTKYFSYYVKNIELNFFNNIEQEKLLSHTQEIKIGNYVKQLIWTTDGFIEYYIDNSEYKKNKIKKLEISLELCSEANGYNENYPSDISFWINDFELGIYKSLGDYGDRYGKFTPSWWYEESTKYGQLVNISLSEDGIYINGKLINKKLNISNINLTKNNYFSFKIGVKKDAVNHGGFNIFGEKFGDYNQGIIFTAYFSV